MPPLPPGTVLPEGPRISVDVTYPAATRTLRVTSGGSLQRAIDTARFGDEIVLAGGATYTGNFILPRKDGAGWIVIRSDVPLSGVPSGRRVTPGTSQAFAKVLTPNSAPVFKTATGAAGYRLVALEVSATASTTLSYGLIVLGSGDNDQSTLASAPSNLVIDRSYVHGFSSLALQRCISLNSASTAVIDSYISGCHMRGTETQAIAGWNGPGPFLIQNNHIEASGINVMFGGADPWIPNMVPSDIVIRGNYFFKPTSWRGVFTVKNLLELKNAQRVLVEGNLLENSWPDAQVGWAIVLAPNTDNNNANGVSTRVRDILLRANVIRNARGGVTMSARLAWGTPRTLPGEPMSRVALVGNLFENVGTDPAFGRLPLLQMIGELRDMTVAFNTFSTEGQSMVTFDELPSQSRLTFVANVMGHGLYGFFGSNVGVGMNALTTYAPGFVVRGNVLAGAPPSANPSDNFFPSRLADVGFVNAGGGNFALSTPSTYQYLGRVAGIAADEITAVRALPSPP
jgi:hypothetical protein